jgi:hypothetical protein
MAITVEYIALPGTGDVTPLQAWFDSHDGAIIDGIFNTGNNVYIAWHPTGT